jgi:DUF1009 family protein
MENLALIAGCGDLPLRVAQGARAAGKNVIVFALQGESSPELASEVSEIFWITPENFPSILKKFISGEIKQITSVGGINKLKWLEIWRASSRSGAAPPPHGGDGAILSVWKDFMAALNIEILDPIDFLKFPPVPEGILCGPPLSPELQEDVNFAFQMSKTLGYHDIGQTVVVKNKVVLAVESIEGTDTTIRRGGELGKSGVVVAKTARPGQDLRLDRPVVGLKTIQTLVEIRAAVLALEAETVLLMDPEASIALSRKGGLSIVARKL